MTIKEVEQKTGLRRSNIRFYEKEKLITPAKNSANGYKDYSPEDVNTIQKIAYLRTLGVSIESIRAVMQQEITLYEVIQSQSAALETQIAELKNSKKVCDMMLQTDALTFENLNIEAYGIKMNDYWKKNRKLLRFDSAGFLYQWASAATWRLLLSVCLLAAIVSYPALPAEIPVQWNAGAATSWMSKHLIFAFPVACIIIRTMIRPILYRKVRTYTPHVEIVTEYIANSMCLAVLSAEVFSILFLAGLVKNIVVMFLAEGIILAILFFLGVRG